MSMHASQCGFMSEHIFLHVKKEFLLTTILETSVDFQHLWAVVSVLSAWWTRKLWEFEFEKECREAIVPRQYSMKVWGANGFQHVSIPTQKITLQPREIGLSLHNVKGNKYTSTHALKDRHKNILSFCFYSLLLTLVCKDNQFFHKCCSVLRQPPTTLTLLKKVQSMRLSFFAFQVLAYIAAIYQ